MGWGHTHRETNIGHTWNTFVTIMQRLGFDATTGWDNMTREVYTSFNTHGVSISYDLVDQCLIKLDAKLVDNPVDLVSTGALYAIRRSTPLTCPTLAPVGSQRSTLREYSADVPHLSPCRRTHARVGWGPTHREPSFGLWSPGVRRERESARL